jgi:hypothetical protein
MFERLHQGQRIHPARLVSALGRAPAQHAMSHARLIFLVVLVVFFCSLFIGSYIWMRRPSFGQVGGRRERGPSQPGTPDT